MFSSIIGSQITLGSFLICTGVSLLLGICIALLSTVKSHITKSYALALALLPSVVELVILLVNGNLGAGLAVAGAFGLVRFRSAPGSAKEILMLFLSVAVGLATGMGYVLLAAVFFVMVAAAVLVLTLTPFADTEQQRDLRITIPETMDYDGLFDDLMEKYLRSYELIRVKTTSLGTMYELEYRITLREKQIPKEFLDLIRARNGNLNVTCGKVREECLL